MKTYYIKEMLDGIFDHIKAGHTVYLQWLCPECGEKVTASDPLRLVVDLHDGEEKVALHVTYRHDDCNTSVSLDDKAYNFMLLMGFRP